MKTINLSEYSKNNYSQNGEDGIVEKLFELLNIKDGFLIEFGCWEGTYLSNTHYHANKNPAFKRLLIEEKKERFDELVAKIPWTENNILLNLKVEVSGENSLNKIFSKYNIENVALLSIDIDGGDLDIFKSLDTKKYRPAIVIIEHGLWKNKISLNSLNKAFSDKGYALVCVTGNCIFVDAKCGIKAQETIHGLIKNSGFPEYVAHFGGPEVGEQIIEIPE